MERQEQRYMFADVDPLPLAKSPQILGEEKNEKVIHCWNTCGMQSDDRQREEL
jgi:hypothetical protein